MAADPQGFQPIAARLRPPRSGVAVVRRAALLARLGVSPVRLVLVSAPAGYGKTTVVRQWLEETSKPAAWLRLEEMHDDPVALLAYLTKALSSVVAIDASVPQHLHTRNPLIEQRVLPALAAALEQAPPFDLVLDDAHLVRSELGWRYLGLLLDALPEGAALVVTTRTRPPLPLARLRAAGDLLELDVDDLRMDRDETDALLRLHGHQVDDAALDAIVDATEGWPTGLYLSLLAGDPAVAGIQGDLREIAEYLTSEVLDRQPEEVRRFLLQAAVLDQLSASVCRAVTERSDAGQTLERLSRDNLFLTPLDDHGEWFRYHHLFGELLLSQLLLRAPDSVGDLHRRAARWYRDHDDADRSVRHSVEAGEAEAPEVVHLAALACDRHIMSGQLERARLLLERFTDGEVMRQPALGLTAAQLALEMDDARVRRLGRHALSKAVSFAPAPLGISSLRAWQVLMSASYAPEGPRRMLEDAELAVALHARGDAEWLMMAKAMRAVALYLLGRARHAIALIAECLPDEDPEARVWWLGLRALIAVDQEDWELARALDAEAHRAPLRWAVLPPMLAHALVLAHVDDPETLAYIDRAAKDLAAVFAGTEWRHLLGADAFGEASLRAGDAAGVDRWLAEAEGVLLRYPEAGILRDRTRRLRAAVESLRMADPLTPAEQRILELLPTQLTAGQIAVRLFITRNTVKSHMRHIYDKLDVNRRTDAVEAARRLGLI